MENNAATQRLLEKMFEATLKQRFSQFARIYNQELVVRTWEQIAKNGGIKLYLRRRDWDSPLKIVDALDYLDGYCDSIESVIRDHDRREKGKRKII